MRFFLQQDRDETTIVESTTPPTPPRQRRFGFLYILLVVVMGLIIGRSFHLQIIQGRYFRLAAEGNRVSVLPRLAPRGIIYDRQGQQLVENIASTDLFLDPTLLPSEEHEAPLFDHLPSLAKISHDDIRVALTAARERQRVTLLRSSLTHDEVIALEGARDMLPGVQLVSSSVRSYQYAYALAHVLGYTGEVSEDELRERDDLLLQDITGKVGIEKVYDQQLRGRHGADYIEVNAAGQIQKDVGAEAPVEGLTLRLTINAQLQQFIYDLLSKQDSERQDEGKQPLAAAVVVLDPQSGGVWSLVSYPSFDANTFVQPSRFGGTGSFLTAELEPLFNRPVSGTYPPGSTIKPLLAAAALEEGVISRATSILSTGGISVGPWFFPDWKAQGHGATDVIKAIAESVNTYFYVLAGGDATHRGLGAEVAADWLEEFSWGQLTGIDLPGEAAGLLPGPAWKEQNKNEPWYIGDTYHMAIGQGDVLVTPLQLAVATAAIANRGMVYQPYLVDEMQDGNGKTIPHEAQGRQLSLARRHLETVRDGMRQAVVSGSARRLSSLPQALAGKTGTAQIGGTDETHAWFTSFGPYAEPELVVTVLLERGGNGDTDAVPVAQEIWEWIMSHQ